MNKFLTALVFSATIASPAMAQRIQQDLGRGVVAVDRHAERSVTSGTEGKLVSWRRLATESEDTQFNVYQNGTLLATTKNTNLKLEKLVNNDVFKVVPVLDGKEDETTAGEFKYSTAKQPYSNVFMKINFEGKVCDPDSYDAKYIWPADLDGNGEYDYIVGQVSRDHSKNTDKVQAYKADGTYLWTVDMGANTWICEGQNDQVLAYDINCDGKAEVLLRSSEGTRFWDKSANDFGLYPFKSDKLDIDGDGITNYENSSTRIPPFYISVVDGLTGAELTSAELDYSQVHDGNDQYGRDKRSSYMSDNFGHEYAFMAGHYCITYTDGIHPSLMMECLDRDTNKSHHNYVFEFKFDWNNGKPSNWHHSYTWSRNDKTPWPAEFHQLRVADVDGDGIDEMLEGGYAVNPVKDMIFSAGIGHGDRYRVSDIDPTRPGMETYAIQQSNLLGQVIYDAATGEHLKEWYLPNVFDVGRGECMDVDPDHIGYEVYSTMDNLYDCKGNVIKEGATSYPCEGIWWDGDLAREVLNTPGGSGYSSNVMITKYNGGRLAEFSQEANWETHAGWAVRPAFFGDIIGDWREEVILLYNPGGRNLGLMGYTTNIPTDYSFYTLQHDPHYRLDCTTRGYYQSPNTSFYLGYDMPLPPLPAVQKTDLRWANGSSWANGGSGFTSFDQVSASAFADGKSVVFDISGNNSQTIALNSDVKPSATYIMAPVDHDYTFAGTGAIAGTGNVWKSERGNATINANITTTGTTIISNGVLNVNGTIAGNVSLRALGTLGGKTTINGDVDLEGSLNVKGCRLLPKDVITFGKSLTIGKTNPFSKKFGYGLVVETSLGDGSADMIKVNGKLTITRPLQFVVDPKSQDNERLKGEYTLVEATEGIECADDMVNVSGLDGHPFSVKIADGKIKIVVDGSRDAAQNVVWSGAESNRWDYSSPNFSLEGSSTPFVKNDKIVFDDKASVKTVQLDAKMIQSGVEVNTNDTYTFNGEGAISGTGDVVKEGKGKLIMNLKNNDYTGRTIINGGTLSIGEILDAGQVCPIGTSAAAASNLQINGGNLEYTGTNSATNHGIALTDTATITVTKSNGSLALNGNMSGTKAILVKDGAGQLSFCQTSTQLLKGIILANGTIAQGDYRMSFGSVPFLVTGKNTTFRFVANSSMNTIPYFKNAVTIAEGAKLTIDGTNRAGLQGSFAGAGTLVLNVGGVRYDISSNMANFAGTLQLNGGARLMSTLTDMKKLTLQLGDGSSLRHYQGGSSTTVAASLNVGALANAAGYSSFKTKPSFGADNESWNVGYNNADASYSGILSAKSITKVGTGNWTLNGNESTSNIIINGGKITIFNVTGNTTTGTITIANGGELAGTGSSNHVVMQKGSVLNPGLNENVVGQLKVNGNLTVQTGATIKIKVSASSNSRVNVAGDKFTMLGNDTILISPIAGRAFAEGDRLVIFNGQRPANGWIIKSTDGSEWDDTTLATDGAITCKMASTGIAGIDADANELVDVVTLDGIVIRNNVARSKATDKLPHGVYIVGGKVIRK